MDSCERDCAERVLCGLDTCNGCNCIMWQKGGVVVMRLGTQSADTNSYRSERDTNWEFPNCCLLGIRLICTDLTVYRCVVI